MKSEDTIFIACDDPSPRLEFIAGFLSDSLGLNFTVTTESVGNKFQIHYGKNLADNSFNIPESGFLNEKGVRSFTPDISINNGFYLFPFEGDYDLEFDLFSAVFYLVSRYEEYLAFMPDRHGRFDVKESYSYRNGFHNEPVVDQWLTEFKKALEVKCTGLKFPDQSFRFVSTVDIDSPWAFKNRKTGKNLPGIFKNLFTGRFKLISQRLKVLKGKETDPFDVYQLIQETEMRYNFSSLFVLLFADNGKLDPNHSLHTREFKALASELAKGHRVGIHPSYESQSASHKLEEEFRLFTSTLGVIPVLSRQHFLLLRFPDTYRRLAEMGIKDDYSMGYASLPAFRAGTSLPFKFYDLKRELTTSLTVHPFTVMDVTLQQYLKLDPEEAIKTVSGLIRKIKQVNGIFTSLWHNESLSEYGPWKGWRDVFTEMVREATDLQ